MMWCYLANCKMRFERKICVNGDRSEILRLKFLKTNKNLLEHLTGDYLTPACIKKTACVPFGSLNGWFNYSI